jgi:hypothetical protein
MAQLGASSISQVPYQVQISVIVGSILGAYGTQCCHGLQLTATERGCRPKYDGSRRHAEGEKVGFALSNTGGDKRHVT